MDEKFSVFTIARILGEQARIGVLSLRQAEDLLDSFMRGQLLSDVEINQANNNLNTEFYREA